MTQIDASIPLRVKSTNLGDLADSYFLARKMADDRAAAAQERAFRTQQIELAKKADNRAENQDIRAQEEHDQTLEDLSIKRKQQRRARLNSFLGEEAEAIAALPSEKRAAYYKQYLIPGLSEEGFDTSDMPDYSDDLIHGWRMKALSPDQRSTERMSQNKAPADNYAIKIDANGNYIYMPKSPGLANAPAPVPTNIGAPPQIGYGQGPLGPMAFATPRSGQNPVATPLKDPTGAPVTRPLIQMPEAVKKDLRDNFAQLSVVKQIENALSSAATTGTGPDKGLIAKIPLFGDLGLQIFDKEGAPSRQLIAQLSSLKMRDISGAVINAHEFPRLAQWIPQIGDTKPVVLQKLKNFSNAILALNQEISQQYTKEQGYKPDPLISGTTAPTLPAATPAPKVGPQSEADIDNMTEEQLIEYLGGSN